MRVRGDLGQDSLADLIALGVGQPDHGVAEALGLNRVQVTRGEQGDGSGQPGDELVGVEQTVLRDDAGDPQDEPDLLGHPVPLAIEHGLVPGRSSSCRRLGCLLSGPFGQFARVDRRQDPHLPSGQSRRLALDRDEFVNERGKFGAVAHMFDSGRAEGS